VRSGEPVIPGRFELWGCAVCGTAVTAGPALAELPDLRDQGDYGGGAPRLSSLAQPLLRRFDAQRLSFVAGALQQVGHRGPVRLLDVGAGRGRFVDSARRAGLRAEGIEPSRRGISAAAERYGIALTPGTIEEANLSDASFDAITLWHVLEHLEDPAASVSTLARALRPGGVLLVGVPNLDSWQSRLGGERWFHLDVPRHRTHFTPRGLESLVVGAGLRPLVTHHVLAEHNPFGMWQTGVSAIVPTPSYLYHLLKHNAPLRAREIVPTLLALPLVPLAVLAELVAGWRGAGGTIALAAVRPDRR
jgi:SAM-dependent methyltransferase